MPERLCAERHRGEQSEWQLGPEHKVSRLNYKILFYFGPKSGKVGPFTVSCDISMIRIARFNDLVAALQQNDQQGFKLSGIRRNFQAMEALYQANVQDDYFGIKLLNRDAFNTSREQAGDDTPRYVLGSECFYKLDQQLLIVKDPASNQLTAKDMFNIGSGMAFAHFAASGTYVAIGEHGQDYSGYGDEKNPGFVAQLAAILTNIMCVVEGAATINQKAANYAAARNDFPPLTRLAIHYGKEGVATIGESGIRLDTPLLRGFNDILEEQAEIELRPILPQHLVAFHDALMEGPDSPAAFNASETLRDLPYVRTMLSYDDEIMRCETTLLAISSTQRLKQMMIDQEAEDARKVTETAHHAASPRRLGLREPTRSVVFVPASRWKEKATRNEP